LIFESRKPKADYVDIDVSATQPSNEVSEVMVECRVWDGL